PVRSAASDPAAVPAAVPDPAPSSDVGAGSAGQATDPAIGDPAQAAPLLEPTTLAHDAAAATTDTQMAGAVAADPRGLPPPSANGPGMQPLEGQPGESAASAQTVGLDAAPSTTLDGAVVAEAGADASLQLATD